MTAVIVPFPERRVAPQFVSLFECRGRWVVITNDECRDASFTGFEDALSYAKHLAESTGGWLDVYRLDRDISA